MDLWSHRINMENSCLYLEMNFAKRLTPLRATILVTRDSPERLFANNSGSFLSLLTDHNSIRSMNLIIRKHTVLQYEPPRSPTFSVIHPLMQNTCDANLA